MFNLEFLHGNANGLSSAFFLVLTESMAKTIQRDRCSGQDPESRQRDDYEIGGVVKDGRLIAGFHVVEWLAPFGYLFPPERMGMTQWGNNGDSELCGTRSLRPAKAEIDRNSTGSSLPKWKARSPVPCCRLNDWRLQRVC